MRVRALPAKRAVSVMWRCRTGDGAKHVATSDVSGLGWHPLPSWQSSRSRHASKTCFNGGTNERSHRLRHLLKMTRYAWEDKGRRHSSVFRVRIVIVSVAVGFILEYNHYYYYYYYYHPYQVLNNPNQKTEVWKKTFNYVLTYFLSLKTPYFCLVSSFKLS